MTYALIAWRFLRGLPWWAYAILAAIAIVWLAYRAGYNARDERADREMSEMLASVEAGQERARAAQIAVNQAAEQRYQELAERTDREYRASQVEAMSAADRYIERNRVRPPSGGVASPAGAAPQGDGASGVVGPDQPAIVDAVAVSAEDVRICTVNTSRLIAAQLWAMGLADEE